MKIQIIKLLEALIFAVVSAFGQVEYDVQKAQELQTQIDVIREIESGNYIFAQ